MRLVSLPSVPKHVDQYFVGDTTSQSPFFLARGDEKECGKDKSRCMEDEAHHPSVIEHRPSKLRPLPSKLLSLGLRSFLCYRLFRSMHRILIPGHGQCDLLIQICCSNVSGHVEVAGEVFPRQRLPDRQLYREVNVAQTTITFSTASLFRASLSSCPCLVTGPEDLTTQCLVRYRYS